MTKKQLLVLIPDELKTRFKAFCEIREMSLQRAVECLIHQALDNSPKVSFEPFHHKCKSCGKEWSSGKADPRVCPACKSYRWQDDPFTHTCLACRYTWHNYKVHPATCPKCRSNEWDSFRMTPEYRAFRSIWIETAMPWDYVAHLLGTTMEKLMPYIQGDKPLTQAHVDKLKEVWENAKNAKASR